MRNITKQRSAFALASGILLAALGIGGGSVGLGQMQGGDLASCYSLTTNMQDNAGAYDSCMGLNQANCRTGPGCQVYQNLPVPGQYCGYCSDEGCHCSTGIPVNCLTDPGQCQSGGQNPCWCKYSDIFPPPPLDSGSVDNCAAE
jgi:hypothetical protein